MGFREIDREGAVRFYLPTAETYPRVHAIPGYRVVLRGMGTSRQHQWHVRQWSVTMTHPIEAKSGKRGDECCGSPR